MVLAMAGLAVAGVLTLRELHLAEIGRVCGPGGGCDRVLASRYAHVAGVPVALLGVGYYAVTLVVWAVAMALATGKGRRAVSMAALAWAVVGTLASVVFMVLQVAVIRALCPLCTTSAAVCLVAFVLALWLARRRDWDRQPVAAVVVPVLVLGFGVLGWMTASRSQGQGGGGGGDEVVARVGQTPVTRAEMEKDIGGRLRGIAWQTYRTEKEWVDQYLADAVIQREAGQRGLSPADLIEKEVDEPVRKQVEQYLATKAKDVPKEELALVRQQARIQFKADRAEAFVDGLKRKYDARTYLAPPEIREEDLAPDLGWRRGPKDAPARIVIFSDFACPYCADMSTVLDRVMAKFPGKVSVVYRYLPLEEHYRSQDAAVAAECAGRQGKFWEYHDALMKHDGRLGGVNFIETATSLGIDEKKYLACLNSEAGPEQVRRSVTQAQSIGIETTPAVFLNGKRIGGAVSFEELSGRIEQLVR